MYSHRSPDVPPEVNSVQHWAVAVFVGLLLLFFVDNYYPPVDENTVYGLAVGLMLVNCVLTLAITYSPGLRKHTDVFKKVAIAVTIGSSLLAVSVFFNGKLDHGQPTQRNLLIEKRRAIVGGRSTAYEFTLESWRTQGGTERLSVSAYSRAKFHCQPYRS